MNPKILIIDDSPTIANTVEWLLANNGYHVHTANDGLTALYAIQKHAPDLVLLDIRLPHVDGFQILKLIRQKQGFASLPIVMLSGLSGRKVIQRALEAGADAYVQKPVNDDELLEVIAMQLASIAH